MCSAAGVRENAGSSSRHVARLILSTAASDGKAPYWPIQASNNLLATYHSPGLLSALRSFYVQWDKVKAWSAPLSLNL